MLLALPVSAAEVNDSWTLGAPDAASVPANGQFKIGVAYRDPATTDLTGTSFASDISLTGMKWAGSVAAGNCWGQGETAWYPVGDTANLIFTYKNGVFFCFSQPGTANLISFVAPEAGTYTYSFKAAFQHNSGVFTSKGNADLVLTYHASLDDTLPTDGTLYEITGTVTLAKDETFNIGVSRTHGSWTGGDAADAGNHYKLKDRVANSMSDIKFTLTEKAAAPTTPTTPSAPATADGIIAVIALAAIAGTAVVISKKR